MKDHLQETIECLATYKECKVKLQSKINFLNMLKEGREKRDREVGIKSIAYDEIPAKTNKVSSKVEQIAIKNIQMELDLEEEIDSLQYYLMRIDLALVELKDEWKQVLQLKYIEGYPWEYVAIKMGQSKATCRRNGDKAVKAFADRIQGQESYIDLPLFRYIYIEQVEQA